MLVAPDFTFHSNKQHTFQGVYATNTWMKFAFSYAGLFEKQCSDLVMRRTCCARPLGKKCYKEPRSMTPHSNLKRSAATLPGDLVLQAKNCSKTIAFLHKKIHPFWTYIAFFKLKQAFWKGPAATPQGIMCFAIKSKSFFKTLSILFQRTVHLKYLLKKAYISQRNATLQGALCFIMAK